MARCVRVAMIGSGGMAKNHIGPLSKLDDVEVVAFCDVVRERAEALAGEHGGRAFDDPEAMLDSIKPDCVYVLLPPFAHGVELACVERGIPFFVEKPINNNFEQACRIAEAVEQAGLLTSVGYMNRYRQGINRARELLLDDPAVFVSGGWIGGSPKPNPERPISLWWVQKSKSGGQFVEQVTHTVDLVRYLCGEVTAVAAFAAQGFNQGVPGYDIDDALAVSLHLAGGGVCNLVSCCASNARGGVFLDVYAKSVAFSFTGWDHACKVHRQGQPVEEIPGEPDIFAIEDLAFTSAVREGSPNGVRCSYADGLRTLEVTLAANRAAETGEIVALPL